MFTYKLAPVLTTVSRKTPLIKIAQIVARKKVDKQIKNKTIENYKKK